MKLFVAKLPPSVNSDSLRNMFEAFGEVLNAKVIMDHETGVSKGYGFIEMEADNAGQAAIQNLNGAVIDGKEIVVKESEPQPNRPPRSGGPRPFGGGGERRPYQGGGNRFGSSDRPRRDSNDRGGDRGNSRYGGDRDRDRRRYDDDDENARRRRF